MAQTACNLTGTIGLECRGSNGGIKRAYIFSGDTFPTFTETDGAISSISGTGAMLEFAVEKQTSTFVETFNASLENGTIFYQQDLTLVFHKMDTDKRAQVRLMGQKTDLLIVVEDNNGELYVIGKTRGAHLTAGSSNSGTAYGDSNNYTITLTGLEPDPVPFLDDTLDNVLDGITITNA